MKNKWSLWIPILTMVIGCAANIPQPVTDIIGNKLPVAHNPKYRTQATTYSIMPRLNSDGTMTSSANRISAYICRNGKLDIGVSRINLDAYDVRLLFYVYHNQPADDRLASYTNIDPSFDITITKNSGSFILDQDGVNYSGNAHINNPGIFSNYLMMACLHDKNEADPKKLSVNTYGIYSYPTGFNWNDYITESTYVHINSSFAYKNLIVVEPTPSPTPTPTPTSVPTPTPTPISISRRDVSSSDLGSPSPIDVGGFFRSVHNYAVAQGFGGGFPNFHQLNNYYGTVLLSNNGMVMERRDVSAADLQNASPSDIGGFFRAAYSYAIQNGYPGAFPNFHSAYYNSTNYYGIVLIKPGVGYWRDVPSYALNGASPSDIGAFFRAVHDYAVQNGYSAGFPNFNNAFHDNYMHYGVILLK